ncbi:hypothetical protein Bcav_2747 [Beutenbergia cavernae DSM 12333]|uniref:Uncharacterized protein n=1 Tax=Beutenbergia cavernae (strain ATCC BAA-8 / DSM 12333 / CCUG 43141 / JCM 11478 / NBRC 16432 / NCIMB 13614 / HKI 0122) TaxID=471853 RepID=C5BY92_BEUC1|nr:hypothetical protein [Beutenbergia cavernae]ACQ80992.1 hypothetical protein Bcav_2747 [Beutenbergia cavernae DSM 12333]
MDGVRVLLLEGFDDDAVDLTLDALPAHGLTGVTTALLTGLAAEVDLPCEEPTTLLVEVPERSLSVTLDVAPGATVTVSLSPEGLVVDLPGDVGLM